MPFRIPALGAAPLPVPYYASTKSTVAGHWAELEHTFTFTPHLVNQFKYGFMNFGGPPVQNITQGTPQYALSASGVTGLPAGQASENFPNTSFDGANPPAGISTGTAIGWVGNTPTTTNVSETYTALDNINLLKGKHSMNFGGQFQWLENNASTADGPSAPTPLNWSVKETSSLTGSTYTREHWLFLCQLPAGCCEQFERDPAAVQPGGRTVPSCRTLLSGRLQGHVRS